MVFLEIFSSTVTNLAEAAEGQKNTWLKPFKSVDFLGLYHLKGNQSLKESTVILYLLDQFLI